MRLSRRAVSVTGAMALLLAATPFVPELVQDQAFEGPFPFGFQLGMNVPGGVTQSFTPTASSLTAVEFLLGGSGGNPEIVVPVTIRASLDGPALGSSSITIPAGFVSDATNPVALRATFTPAVSLTPGTKYFVNVGQVGWGIGPAVSFSGGYDGGEVYQGLSVLSTSDIGFRTFTGTSGVGPPTTKDACKNDGWSTFTIPRAFKNQGDCIQFVNTGK